MNNDPLLRFEFSSVHNRMKNMNYHVIAENREDLNAFLMQHGFIDAPEASVSLMKREDFNPGEESNLLKRYLFKSNHSDELFTIMTTDDLVDSAIEITCDEVTDALLFGEAILRRDVEAFKMIGDLIWSLPHTNIMDFSLANVDIDDNETATTAKEILDMRKRYCNSMDSLDWEETYYVHQSMDFTRVDTLPQPITIEAYIANFTERMMDVFE